MNNWDSLNGVQAFRLSLPFNLNSLNGGLEFTHAIKNLSMYFTNFTAYDIDIKVTLTFIMVSIIRIYKKRGKNRHRDVNG